MRGSTETGNPAATSAPSPHIEKGAVHRGFADPVRESQTCFRALLTAMAHPGRVVALDSVLAAPAPLASASYALCLSLLDLDTPIWLDGGAARKSVIDTLRFHCGAPIVAEPGRARFAIIANAFGLPRLDSFALGSDERPEDSATLLIQLDRLREGSGWRLAGPGIAREACLDAEGLSPRFVEDWQRNHAMFPRGVDAIFICDTYIAALPRSIRLEG